MKIYLNDHKANINPWPHNYILWGLKAHCAIHFDHPAYTWLKSYYLIELTALSWDMSSNAKNNERNAMVHLMRYEMKQSQGRRKVWKSRVASINVVDIICTPWLR